MSSLAYWNISNQYAVTVRKTFDSLQETSERYARNGEYENFITASMEAAATCIPIKPRANCRIPMESIEVREKRDNMKIASLRNKVKCNKFQCPERTH